MKKKILKEEAIQTRAEFVSYKKYYGGNTNPKVIYVYCKDCEVLTIDG